MSRGCVDDPLQPAKRTMLLSKSLDQCIDLARSSNTTPDNAIYHHVAHQQQRTHSLSLQPGLLYGGPVRRGTRSSCSLQQFQTIGMKRSQNSPCSAKTRQERLAIPPVPRRLHWGPVGHAP